MSALEVLTREPDVLGEGPVYVPEDDALLRVDITGRAVRRLGLGDLAQRSWPVPREIGSLALRAGRADLVVALEDGLCSLDLATGELERLVDVTGGDERIALNDGRCDEAGSFWVGSYERSETEPLGWLVRIDPDLSVTRVADGIIVGNGIDWSPDGARMYVTDSGARTITAFEMEGGLPVRPRIFARDEGCMPDGLVVDAEGCVWSAKWDGWRIVRYTPAGEIDRVIELPVQRPTACTFGGAGFETLFITSATLDLDLAARAAQPLAGLVLALDVGGRGRPSWRFGHAADRRR